MTKEGQQGFEEAGEFTPLGPDTEFYDTPNDVKVVIRGTPEGDVPYVYNRETDTYERGQGPLEGTSPTMPPRRVTDPLSKKPTVKEWKDMVRTEVNERVDAAKASFQGEIDSRLGHQKPGEFFDEAAERKRMTEKVQKEFVAQGIEPPIPLDYDPDGGGLPSTVVFRLSQVPQAIRAEAMAMVKDMHKNGVPIALIVERINELIIQSASSR